MALDIAKLNELSATNTASGAALTPDQIDAAITATGVKGLRRTPSNRIEVQVTSKLLVKGKRTQNFDCPYEAAANALTYRAQLAGGIIPAIWAEAEAELRGESPAASAAPATKIVAVGATIATAISVRLKAKDINLKGHDKDTLLQLSREVGFTPLADLTKDWAKQWVANMKAKKNTPGYIRKKKEALSRAINTYFEVAYPDENTRPRCALDLLPKEYSLYNRHDGEIVEDAKRYIRLPEGKDQQIEDLLTGKFIPEKGKGRGVYTGPYRCKDPKSLLMAFKVLLWTGIRQPEMYQLQVKHVNVAKCKLELKFTKKDYDRPVPLRDWLALELGEYITQRHGPTPDPEALVFPFLKLPKERTVDAMEEAIKKCGARVSSNFRSILDAVGLPDYWPRDLRHEGISRMVEWTKPDGSLMFPRVEAIMEYSGHKSMEMFRIYWNMREHDFSLQA